MGQEGAVGGSGFAVGVLSGDCGEEGALEPAAVLVGTFDVDVCERLVLSRGERCPCGA